MDILADPTEIETTTDGQTPSGALEISVKNIGTAVAMFNGVSLDIGEAKNYGFVGKAYKALSYEVNGSKLRIKITL